MALKKTSKEEILKASIQLFKQRGYHNTSMANIAEACGLIKGSIYHHFKSKDEIGLESLRYIHNYFNENIYCIASNDKLNNKEKLSLFVKKTDEYFLNSKGGCLLGNLALEASYENTFFKEEIKSYFTNWETALQSILEEKYGTSKSIEFAKSYVALTQGTIMMMNLYDDNTEYLEIGKKLTALL